MSRLYNINNHLMEYNDSCINRLDPLNPLNLPTNTIRVKFGDGYTPTMGDTQTLVDSTNNVWDIYKQSNDWYWLFGNNQGLLEVLGADTTNVTSMWSMFQSCRSLTSVSLFDTSNLILAGGMFDSCSRLTTVPCFNTSNVVNVNSMFRYCYSLTSVPSFDTSNVKIMSQMLECCSALSSIPLFDTSNTTTMGYMCQLCTSLTSIPLFDTSKVSDMGNMFWGCTNVQSGALALYQQASTQTTPPSSHNKTFYNCGVNTQTGAAELAQIPSDWK